MSPLFFVLFRVSHSQKDAESSCGYVILSQDAENKNKEKLAVAYRYGVSQSSPDPALAGLEEDGWRPAGLAALMPADAAAVLAEELARRRLLLLACP